MSDNRLADRVAQLVEIMKTLVARGKASADVTVEDWDALAQLVDVDEFERVGPFHDALDWTGYTKMLTGWVNQTPGWDPVVKRVAEAPEVVFVQLEEMITEADRVFPFYSLSMYEFNAAGKIRRIEVYMQQEASAGQGR